MYNFIHLLYTHSDYNNVWPIWHYQTHKFLPESKIVMFTNDSTEIQFDCESYVYDDTKSYTDRLVSCLEQLNPEQLVLFQHEDMFLYASPDINSLNQFCELILEEKIDMVRLIRVVDNLIPTALHKHLYLNPQHDKFSIQPTLCKVKTLLDIFSKVPNTNIWNFETSCTDACYALRSYFCYDGGKKRGISHYDSSLYPYIATAIVKGQWNTREYNKELTDIFSELKLI